MTVRIATEADVKHVVNMTLKFIDAAKMPEASVSDLTAFVTELVSNERGFIAVSEKGFLAGMLAPLYYNSAILEAHEVGWWSQDGQGARLLSAFEKWAVFHGANNVILSTLTSTDSRVKNLFARRGYVTGETQLRKAL